MNEMDDLISREEAIKHATADHDFYRGATLPTDKARRDELLNVMCWLNELPPAEPQWIPVGERLPEKTDQYYVSGGGKVWICEFLIIPNFTGGWCNDASNPVVQAWMPLPKPYEGDR